MEHQHLATINDLLDSRAWHGLRRTLAEHHPADLAELLTDRSEEDEAILLRLLGKRRGDVFAYLGPGHQRKILRRTEPELLARMIREMTPDDRTRLLGELPPEVAHTLLGRLPASEMKDGLALLSYPEDAAGRFMTPHFIALRPDMTAGEALEHIRRVGRDKETLSVVYIVDSAGRLVEDVHLGSLVLAAPATPVTEVADPGLVSIPDTAPREEVIRMFGKYDRVALPVTDKDGHMLGIITADDVLDVAEEEATKDIHMLGGVEALDEPYIQVGFWAMARKRAGWLSALFLGEMLTATAMGVFEAEISRAVVLALFVPLIISSGGNSGSQASTLVIRALALGEVGLRDWWRVIRREVLAGGTLGIILGTIGFLRISIWSAFSDIYGPHWLLVALTVGVALIGIVLWGTLIGSVLPFVLRRLGFDPATSSAPFVATLVDVTGLIIYFTVAMIILRGTLLKPS